MKQFILLQWPESQTYLGCKDSFICTEIDGAIFVPLKEYIKNKKELTKLMLYLESEGWSDLIDERWKNDVKTCILKKYPDTSEEILKELFKFIIY